MTILSRSKTATLEWGSTPVTGVQLTVFPAGVRVCLRAYSMFEFPATVVGNQSQANFRTGSQSGDIIFSDRAPLWGLVYGFGGGTPSQMVEIPGDGVLFDDGLFVELVLPPGVSVRSAGGTYLNVLYS